MTPTFQNGITADAKRRTFRLTSKLQRSKHDDVLKSLTSFNEDQSYGWQYSVTGWYYSAPGPKNKDFGGFNTAHIYADYPASRFLSVPYGCHVQEQADGTIQRLWLPQWQEFNELGKALDYAENVMVEKGMMRFID